VNKDVAFVWALRSTLLNARMPIKLTCGYLYPSQCFTVYSYFGVAAWMLGYGMANEGCFQLLDEDSTSNLSATRKKKQSKAAVENMTTWKSRRWFDAEVDRHIELLEERPCLCDVFSKECHVFIQSLVCSLLVTLSSSSSNISSRAVAAKHFFDRKPFCSANQYGARLFSKDCR